MIIVAVCEEPLNLASEFWGFEQDDIARIGNLLKVFLADPRILPEVSLNRKVHFHL
jgi:hypothetical protein